MPPKSGRPEPRETQQKGGNGDRDNAVHKRAQNRISQQCLREKNSTYIRSLERTVEILQTVVASKEAGSSSSDNQYAVFVEAHLEQTRENQQLREAVLRLRKKLLSLSNAILAAADDEIFLTILGGKQHSESITEKRQISPREVDTELGLVTNQTNTQNEIQFDVGNAAGTSDSGSHMFEPTPFRDETFVFGSAVDQSEVEQESGLDLMLNLHDRNQDPPDHGLEINGHTVTPHIIEEATPSLNAYNESHQLHGVLLAGSDANGLEELDFDLGMMMPSISGPPLNMYNEPIAITSTFVLATRIVSACQQCIVQATGSCARAQDLPQSFRQNLVRAATHFLAHCLGLEQYIYGVNSAQYIEKILGWRLGLVPREAVPSPFRPTPLQSHNQSHYMGIDLFAWPDVRDQLMLAEQKHLDWESLAKDLLLHSVIEQPQRGVAVSVLDVFLNRILPTQSPASSGHGESAALPPPKAARNFLNDPSWVLFTGSVPEKNKRTMTATGEDPVVQAFVAELERRMQVLEASPSTLHAPTNVGSTSKTASRLPKPNDVAAFLGLDNVVEWKLSKEFAQKYPFLDCSGVVSNCDMAPSSAVFCW